MLPGNTSSTLVGNFVRAQQGVLETVRVSADDLRLTVGEKVQALVTNQLNNGRFAVLIKDQLLDLNLPRNTQPGEQFELTVLGKEPQLTFRLVAAQPNLPSTQNQLPQDANVALSKGANLIGQLMAGTDQAAPAEITQSQPLFTGKPDTAQLAGQLASRLASSGLFYESHQAQWVEGQRPLQLLLCEPQAAKTDLTLLNVGTPATKTETNPSVNLAVQGSGEAAEPTIQNFAQKADLDFGVGRQLGMATDAQQVLDDAALKLIVRQQLDLVENKPLAWQGAAWPGQPLRWEVELENERKNSSEEVGEAQQWQTRLQLDLPKLGALGITAQLQAGRFNLRFQAKNDATLQLLQAQQGELLKRFEAAGLTLQSTQISRDE